MAEINKKSLEHLADLARLELSDQETEKFQKDLGNILNYFEELKTIDTSSVVPMTGGTSLKNIFREDGDMAPFNMPDKLAEAFPEKEHGRLKIPPIF
jgi:aspartyl-tRNA(Asn)/glutamyl-tRNA(Gln) amidotransferase subunit C